MTHPDDPLAPPGAGQPPPEPARRSFAALGERLRRIPVGRALLVLAGLFAAVGAFRALRGSFRAVEPGYAAISVSRFTGDIRVLPPGTHFRPTALYDLHAVRVSDQLLSGPASRFLVATKEGVPVQITVQARWSFDRNLLASTWSALPPDPARELVLPIIASAFRAVATTYPVDRVISEKREELTRSSAKQARSRLLESGIVLKEVWIGDLTLPPEYEHGRVELVDEVQNTEKMDVTLKLKTKEIERTRLEAEAQKILVEKHAEASASQRLIAARGESEAMRYVLALKQKEIDQRRLEAEADKQTRVKKAQADAAISKIESEAEVARRKVLAEAEAYTIRTTSAAQFESLKREAELVQANPLLIPKTFADHLSDKVQVILTPTIGGEAFTGEMYRRVANGKPAVVAKASSSADDSGTR